MPMKTILSFLACSFMLSAQKSSAQSITNYSLTKIVVTDSWQSRFYLYADHTDSAFTSSLVVQQALISAYFTRARISLDLIPGTHTIQRVNAFTGTRPSYYSAG